MTTPVAQKITYTSTNVDMEAFHRAYDAALAEVRASAGKSHPLYINDRAVEVPGNPPIVDTSPIDTSFVLGSFAAATPAEVDLAIRAAKAAQKSWAALNWKDRVRILRRAAALIRERKFLLSAIMSYEVGKNRFEAMGDTEESADLIDYYCQQVEDHSGFMREMAKMTPIERNKEVLRPYGVFVCIAPFNFPLALSTGMSSAALMTGNTVVYKPAEDTPWTGLKLYEVYRDAGVPPGVFNFVSGHGREIGDTMWQHPLTDGVVFTGSKAVGMRIFHGLSQNWVKPCLMELGGKNAAIVMDSADLDAAAEGVMRSAFGLQNQKCSATSRVYVHKAVALPFIEKLIEKTKAITMGDVTRRDVWFGPVINDRAVDRWEKAVAQGGKEGKILFGGKRLKGEAFDKGNFVAPTIAELPLGEHSVPRRAVRPIPRRCLGGEPRPGARGGQQGRVRSHRRPVLKETGRDRPVLRRGGGRRLLRQQAERRDDRRLARRSAVHWLEGERLQRQGRLRSMVRAAVHAGAESDSRK